ncbi:general transcription factor II-I repeat domain-containing protein 2-like [Rhopalosiphum padi]|uniref:general transcription factor II-I repeat domain-containing protein 2-like n=1 Tax=Rhopalosiphum padi TaxID=40932 RepID=UPI00298DC894|nr:general transcription factor II-I repeat domain-containing protein 2-like [Rhopalosiphum padi]
MFSKKRKVDNENRKFLAEWTEQYFFTLPVRAGAVPVCLICNSTVAVVKCANLKRHYDTIHKDFEKKFPLDSAARKDKLQAYLLSYKNSTTMLVKSMSGQEKSIEAALRVCWTLNKHQKPFTDSEIVKECILEVATALFEDKKDIINAIQNIPLSARSNTRRTELLADDNKNNLIHILQMAPCYAIAIDESCDIVDSEQMSIFVRFLDAESKVFRDELLALLPLKCKTRGEDLFKTFDDFMTKSNISYDKIVSISTDGAPAMIGKEKGFVKRIKDKNAEILSYQCIIYQTSLCGKLSTTLKEVMDIMIKLINFLRSRSALQHRQFKDFLFECDSVYSDLIQHNNIRWLSKGKVIERFWSIKEEVITFLVNLDSQESKQYHKFLTNESNMLSVAFLKDILTYLNVLNIELQGHNKLICDLISSVSAFRRKLEIFEEDIKNQDFIHFPTILEYKKNSDIDCSMFLSFLSDLGEEFGKRFKDFADIGKLSQFLKNPFEVSPTGEWIDVATKLFRLPKSSLQMEIIDLQEDISLQMNKTSSTEDFWIKHVLDKYMNYFEGTSKETEMNSKVGTKPNPMIKSPKRSDKGYAETPQPTNTSERAPGT